jgi:hypothetical protein
MVKHCERCGENCKETCDCINDYLEEIRENQHLKKGFQNYMKAYYFEIGGYDALTHIYEEFIKLWSSPATNSKTFMRSVPGAVRNSIVYLYEMAYVDDEFIIRHRFQKDIIAQCDGCKEYVQYFQQPKSFCVSCGKATCVECRKKVNDEIYCKKCFDEIYNGVAWGKTEMYNGTEWVDV